jgi:hypothetical protein
MEQQIGAMCCTARATIEEPYKQVFLEMHFSTFSKRISARWSTGMIPRSFWKTTVRLVAAFLDYRF